MSLSSSPESPQPLGRVVMAVKDWIGRLGEIWVDAQVIEVKRRSGPTQFLTFRDRRAEISATVTVSALVLDAAGPLPEGAQVVARVRPRVWERNASLSFECLELRVAGEGQLLAHLEQLKRKLQAEGLFEPHRKRPLPFIPRRIGLITSAGSDAERDVLVNTGQRWPALFTTESVPVQGPHAAQAVLQALDRLDRDPEVDVIIIARGGGALQDLLPFSDEGMVRAIAAATTPVVTAIGHEQDVPLIDFVADQRASTPTAAASLVVPDFRQEQDLVTEARSRLSGAIVQYLDSVQQTLSDLTSRPVLLDPTQTFSTHEDRLQLLTHRLRSGISQYLQREEARLGTLIGTVRATSPKATLERGYALLIDDQRHSVSSVTDTTTGAGIQAWLADGQLDLEVTGIHQDKENYDG